MGLGVLPESCGLERSVNRSGDRGNEGPLIGGFRRIVLV